MASKSARQMEREIAFLEQRVRTLEAELARSSRRQSRERTCPRCRGLSLNLVGKGPHPDFPDEGVELHEVRCDRCGHQSHRLHDPSGLLY